MDKYLIESINDKYYDKAIFVVGPPGSGKSFITKKIIDTFRFKVIDSDDIFVRLMKRDNVSLKMDKHTPAERETTEDNFEDAYMLNRRKTLLAASQRVPIVISRTGRYADDVLDLKERVESYGYNSLLILVSADLKTILKRNSQRERTVDPKVVSSAYNGFSENINEFKKEFDTYIEIDNKNLSPRELIQFEKQVKSWAERKMEKK